MIGEKFAHLDDNWLGFSGVSRRRRRQRVEEKSIIIISLEDVKVWKSEWQSGGFWACEMHFNGFGEVIPLPIWDDFTFATRRIEVSLQSIITVNIIIGGVLVHDGFVHLSIFARGSDHPFLTLTSTGQTISLEFQHVFLKPPSVNIDKAKKIF